MAPVLLFSIALLATLTQPDIPQETHPIHLPWQVPLQSSQHRATLVGKLGITGTSQVVPTPPHPASDASWDWCPCKEADTWGRVAALPNSASTAIAAETHSQSCRKREGRVVSSPTQQGVYRSHSWESQSAGQGVSPPASASAATYSQ